MRAAPAVAVQGRGGPLWAVLHAGLPALAAGCMASWLAAHAGQPGALVAAWAATAAAVVGGWAWRAWCARPASTLCWDGQAWGADGQPVALQLMMDLGRVLVLRLHLQGGGTRWLAIGAAEAGPAWHTLRCAVYSRPLRPTPALLSPERSPD